MALDLVLPAGRCLPDESVASFVQRRLGREAFDRIAEPMIGTIYTADAAALSLAATMPRFLELERRYGSVIRGLMRSRAAADSHVSGSRDDTARHSGRRVGMFATLSDGMQALVNAAAGTLPAASLHVRTPVSSLAHASDGGGYRLALAGSAGGVAVVEADAVVIATSAPAAVRLLASVDERLAAGLSAIRYASSASVTLAYRRTEVRHPLDGAGFVVPRKEGRPVLAASFSSVKFPGRAPEGRALLRVFVGGALAPDLVDRDDDALVAVAHREIETLLGAAAPPIFARVHRHRDAMPQYTVGHLARVAEIEGRLAGHHGLALAGAAYRGVGISDCIRSGEAAAEQVLVHVRQRGFTASGVRP
jgi:oxygen-dependent protoporphyrinogen oxidase